MYERKQHRKWVTVDIDRNKFNNKKTVEIHLVLYIILLGAICRLFCFRRVTRLKKPHRTYYPLKNGKRIKS